jgi:hypothetical protein
MVSLDLDFSWLCRGWVFGRLKQGVDRYYLRDINEAKAIDNTLH